MRIALAALAAVALAALSASTALGQRAAARCTGGQLAGVFSAVRGSAGAGSISYRLTLLNVSGTSCTLTGLPQGQLLGKAKQQLPTHVRAAHPGMLAAVLVTLAPGDSATALARLSPDVPGVGEGNTSTCEPVAYWLRVRAQGGGTTTVRLAPPTPVCEHGALFFSAYARTG